MPGTPALAHAAAPDSPVRSGPPAESFRSVLCRQKVPICRHFSRRRRDSNPRHADYDSEPFSLWHAVRGAGGQKRGHNCELALSGQTQTLVTRVWTGSVRAPPSIPVTTFAERAMDALEQL